jgi:ElaB/YqjD/DUF883 family membrane-anchored ribosome-binding protein
VPDLPATHALEEAIMKDSEAAAEKVAADLRMIISDVEGLLRATAGQAGEAVADARAKVLDSLDVARARLGSLGEEYVEQARAVDGYVREHPWQAVGVAALAGVVLGLLITRR